MTSTSPSPHARPSRWLARFDTVIAIAFGVTTLWYLFSSVEPSRGSLAHAQVLERQAWIWKLCLIATTVAWGIAAAAQKRGYSWANAAQWCALAVAVGTVALFPWR